MPPELYTVAEIATFSKLTLRANEHEFVDYLDTGNLTEGLIQSLEHYSDLSKLPSRAKKIVIEGDILFSTVRPNNRHYGIIHGNSKNLVVSTGFSVIRANRNIVLPEYLYYHLTSNSTVELLQSIAEQSVSAYPSINDSDIGKLEFKIPDIQIQKTVIKIIESINQKLSINREINANLMAICETKYAHLANQSKETVQLKDLVEVCYGKDHKKLKDGNIPVYGSGGIMRYVERPLFDGKESVLIPRKGSLNNVMYVSNPFWSVDTMFFTKVKKLFVAKYLYFFLKNQDLSSLNSGSAVPSMTTDILNEIELPYPGDEELQSFDNMIQPLFNQINNNDCENYILYTIRDTLLPKLMSGEIDVSQLDLGD